MLAIRSKRLPIIFNTVLAVAAIPAFLMGAQIPEGWIPEDYPSGQPNWYSVEVGSYASRLLASGTEEVLLRENWAPVIVDTTTDGRTTILLGETDNIGEAYYLLHELRQQQITEGKVVAYPPAKYAPTPRGLYSDRLYAAFQSSPGVFENIAGDFSEEEMLRKLGVLADSQEKLKTPVTNFITQFRAGNLTSPDLGGGAVVAAREYWSKRVEPAISLYLAGNVARGQWAATLPEQLEAQQIASELLYGYLRDWRASWRAAKALAGSLDTNEARNKARLRQVALLVELIQQRVEPAPSWGEVRYALRRIQEALPDDNRDPGSRLQLLYIQTFAWEGRWDRVEDLSRRFLKNDWNDITAELLVRTLLARSLERTKQYDEARRLLSEVVTTPLEEDQFLRYGVAMRDPREEARRVEQHFLRLIIGLDPVAPKPVVADDDAAALDFLPSTPTEEPVIKSLTDTFD